MTNRVIRVLIADDHPMVREGIRAVLQRRRDIEIVAETSTGRETVTQALHLRPDVALVDLDMPLVPGTAVVAELARALPACRCVVLTMHEDDRHLFDAIAAGAAGFLVKGATGDDIERAIRAAATGQVLFGAEVAARITAAATTATPRPGRSTFPQLSDRDLDLLDHIARGLDNPAIARHLGYAPKTIRNLVSALLGKLEVTTRADAIQVARRAGLGDTRHR